MKFKLVSPYNPAGDQPEAIEEITARLQKKNKHQILLGVTGSGKTFTVANVIENIQKPTLVITHNKTLAAQLYNEFKTFFPYNAVEYFVSYYDYYQPESYIVKTDTYIEKDSSINEQIDMLRHNATASVLSRKDVIIVASVSSIYNIGKPDYYEEASFTLSINSEINWKKMIKKFISMHYIRNDFALAPGVVRVRGEVIDVMPPYFDNNFYRIHMFDDDIEAIYLYSLIDNKRMDKLESIKIFPAKHYIIPDRNIKKAIEKIENELQERIRFFKNNNKHIEAQRISERTKYDIEMIKEFGYCKGIENYSRYFDGRKPGEAPWSLLSYFSDNYNLIVDESHITIPQIYGMSAGDYARKKNLIDYGFRLPSAFDNRPLTFNEWQERTGKLVYVSATPGKYELEKAQDKISYLINRPTGITEPKTTILKTENQIFQTVEKLKKALDNNLKVIINTLTKKMSEKVTQYLCELDFKVKYLHSEIHTIDRTKIINELKRNELDIIVGVNLLREGIDLPEVGLVIIFDGDKEGFLRSTNSLIQLAGRCARNIDSEVVIFADNMTKSLKNALNLINGRREKQVKWNKKHNINPQTIKSRNINKLEKVVNSMKESEKNENVKITSLSDVKKEINYLKYEMKIASSLLEFEKAAKLRDKIKVLEQEFVKFT
ncbi:MAG: excinuclease ABC subunit UvrB [Candidatus Muiribacteriota bacterium]